MLDKVMKVLLVEDNPGDARLVQEMLSEAEGSRFHVQHTDSLLHALEALARSDFDVALVDLSLPDCHGMQSLTTLQTHAPGLPIVVLTGLESDSMALDAMRSGVQDYLIKGKLATDSLVRALEYAIVRQVKSVAEPSRATVLGFLSSKGGVGTTTIACHFSCELRRQTEQKVLLVDLDLCSAAASFLLRANSASSILDAATNLHRLDVQFWKRLVAPAPDGVDLIQSPGAVRFGDQLDGERVRHVLRFSRSLYQWILVDLGRLDVLSISLLNEIRDLFVITTEELPALYETKRVMKQLLEKGVSREHIRLVLNRAPRTAMATTHDFEQALGFPFYGVLHESHQLKEDYTEGRMVDVSSDLGKGIAKVVSKCLGGAPTPPAVPGRFSIFRLGARLTH